MNILSINLKTNSKQMKKIVLIILVLISFTGCEKYFGDKNMTLELKLILGDWYCESIFVNNIDSTFILKDTVGTWVFKYAGKNATRPFLLFMGGIGVDANSFVFEFIENSKKITIYTDKIKILKLPENRWVYRELTAWEILELSENKLKLRSEPIKSNTYEIHFYKN